MMKDFFKVVDDYITGRLSAEDLVEFEKELNRNIELQKKVKLNRELSNAMLENEIYTLRNNLNSAYSKFKSKKQIIIIKWSALAVASITAVLIVLSNLINNPNEFDLFDKYYKRFELSGIERGTNQGELLNIFENYNNNNYKEVIKLLNDSTSYLVQSSSIKLVLSCAYLETGQPTHAEKILREVLMIENDINFETAKWYLCLTLMKQGKLTESYNICKELVSYKGKYYNQSLKLKNSLEGLVGK